MESINYKELYENMLEEHNKIKNKLEEIIKILGSLNIKINQNVVNYPNIPDLDYVM